MARKTDGNEDRTGTDKDGLSNISRRDAMRIAVMSGTGLGAGATGLNSVGAQNTVEGEDSVASDPITITEESCDIITGNIDKTYYPKFVDGYEKYGPPDGVLHYRYQKDEQLFEEEPNADPDDKSFRLDISGEHAIELCQEPTNDTLYVEYGWGMELETFYLGPGVYPTAYGNTPRFNYNVVDITTEIRPRGGFIDFGDPEYEIKALTGRGIDDAPSGSTSNTVGTSVAASTALSIVADTLSIISSAQSLLGSGTSGSDACNADSLSANCVSTRASSGRYEDTLEINWAPIETPDVMDVAYREGVALSALSSDLISLERGTRLTPRNGVFDGATGGAKFEIDLAPNEKVDEVTYGQYTLEMVLSCDVEYRNPYSAGSGYEQLGSISNRSDIIILFLPEKPAEVATGSATVSNLNEVTLRGEINDISEGTLSGPACQVWFEYEATDDGPDNRSTTDPQTVSSEGEFSATVDDLEPGTEYQYWVVIKKEYGAAKTAEVRTMTSPSTFTTNSNPPAGSITTGQPIPVSKAAKLSGEVEAIDADGVSDVEVWFELRQGSSGNFREIEVVERQTPGSQFNADVQDLENGVTYEYRAVMQVEDSTVTGELKTFQPSGWDCAITTATANDAETLDILRRYRDESMSKTPVGRALVGLYYRISPPIAQTLFSNPNSVETNVIRKLIYRCASLSEVQEKTDSRIKSTSIGILLAIIYTIGVFIGVAAHARLNGQKMLNGRL